MHAPLHTRTCACTSMCLIPRAACQEQQQGTHTHARAKAPAPSRMHMAAPPRDARKPLPLPRRTRCCSGARSGP